MSKKKSRRRSKYYVPPSARSGHGPEIDMEAAKRLYGEALFAEPSRLRREYAKKRRR